MAEQWEINDTDLNNKIKTIIREHHFTPVEIDALFVDRQDYHGLDYLYDDINEVHAQLEKK